MGIGFEDRKVIVTGATAGIGLACAKEFLRQGARVVVVGRNRDKLDEVAAQTPELEIHLADLSREAERTALFEAQSDADILVNNAGAIPGGRLDQIPMDRWREAWELKVFGYIHLCKLFYAGMSERRSGTILNMIGIGGRAPKPDYICGAAGNAALIAFTEALGGESSQVGVRVLGLNPGMTFTDRARRLIVEREGRYPDKSMAPDGTMPGMPFGRMATVAEVANLTVFLCGEEVAYVNGTVVDIDGGNRFR